MTVITKPRTLLKQLQYQRELSKINNDNTVVYFEEEDKVEVKAERTRSLLYVLLQVVLIVGLLTLLSLLIYYQCFRVATVHRYQGFCTIPIPRDQRQLMEPRWSPGPDVQVFSSLDETTSDELVNLLREHLDIEDMMEKISVYDNGRQINFIHDFNDNVTGIVDVDRCYTMELDPELVLSPSVFVKRIERGEGLDTSVVRGVWRAVLPPPHRAAPAPAAPAAPAPIVEALAAPAFAAPSWGALCDTKPVYKLQREHLIIRKRSADEPPHEYMQFSGKHITAIAIDNLAELRDYENKYVKKTN